MNLYALNATPLNGYEWMFGAGSSTIAVTMQGAPMVTRTARGAAGIQITGRARTTISEPWSGSAHITFGGRYAIPNALPVPTVYYATPRVIRVPQEHNVSLC